MNAKRLALVVLLIGVLAGCATAPPGPSLSARPGSGKSMEAFRSDDAGCRQIAEDQVSGVSPGQAAADSAARSAVLGTAIGAGAGALIGGSRAAGVGAGVGLLMGGLIGSDAAYASGAAFQRRYDATYRQCMYDRGHKIPVDRRAGWVDRRSYNPPPPPPRPSYGPPADASAYPPPPDTPPPPAVAR